MLLNFVHVCSLDLAAERQREHCVLLIVQPLECADDAGFTPVQSHCCILHSSAVSCSHIFVHANLLSVMQRFWRPHQEKYYQNHDRKVQRLKPMNKTACVRRVNVHFTEVLPSAGRAEVKSDEKQARGRRGSDI